MIEPRTVELALGTTARLKLIGQYKDGTTADLTDAAEWKPQNDKIVFARAVSWKAWRRARPRFRPATAPRPESPYASTPRPTSAWPRSTSSRWRSASSRRRWPSGRGSRLRIDAVGEDGKHYSVLESSQLKTEVGPSYLASVHGASLRGDRVGRGKLSASFGDGLKAERTSPWPRSPASPGLEVHPGEA